VSGYTVTITPSGGRSGPQTTIHVETANGTPRVTELTVRGDRRGVSAPDLPAIDFAGLVAALSPAPAPTETAPAATGGGQPRGRRTRKPATAKAAARKTAATKTAATKVTRRRRRAADTDTPAAGRAYRRMPDQDEVVAAWQSSGSTSAVAAHFAVPRHTASGWLRRLRTMGVIEPPS
jgi:hypothetical protein